jgi:putative ABC transport system permease protein
MNLAFKDISYHRFRFLSSTLGVSLLVLVIVTIGGIIRGVILDSATIIEKTGADLWVVQAYGAHPQGGTLGPFVEMSRLPQLAWHAIQSIPGVAEVGPLAMAWEHLEVMPQPTPLMKFMYLNTLLNTATMVEPGWMAMPKLQRFVVVGYQLGKLGGPAEIVTGRGIEASHYELVADMSTGFHVKQKLHLGNFDYTVVGLTQHMVGYTADPVIYATLPDAQNIIFQSDPNLLRSQRAAVEGNTAELAATQPRLQPAFVSNAVDTLSNTRFINAIAVKVQPGTSVQAVAEHIERWQHLKVYTAAQSVNLQLMGSNRLILFQLALFRDILVIIAGTVIGLIIYTFTLDKLHEIAMLKILGAPSTMVYGMILQEALLIGVTGTLLGSFLEFVVEPYFPRRVLATTGDVLQLLIAMTGVTLIASILAVRRAMHADPRSVIGTL